MTEGEQFEHLVQALDDVSSREDAVRQLAALNDPRAVDPLSNVIRTPDTSHAMAYRARQLAAEALGKLRDPRGIPALKIALEDSSSAVKISAAKALAEFREPDSVPVISHLLQDRNPEVRIAAAQAITRIAQHEDVSIQPLIALLADFEDEVRDAVTECLRELSGRAFETLLAALNDPNSTIRGAAASLLGELRDERAYKALRKVRLGDSSQWVRSRAEWAIDQLPPVDDIFPRTRTAADPPQNTLELVRSRAPKEWPSLRKDKSVPDPNAMTPEQVQAMLDQLDLRLMNGEISEETYRRLVERWEKRLK